MQTSTTPPSISINHTHIIVSTQHHGDWHFTLHCRLLLLRKNLKNERDTFRHHDEKNENENENADDNKVITYTTSSPLGGPFSLLIIPFVHSFLQSICHIKNIFCRKKKKQNPPTTTFNPNDIQPKRHSNQLKK